MPNINIKEKKEEIKEAPKTKKAGVAKVDELPSLPNINIKEKKEEIKENSKAKNSDIQIDKSQTKDKKGFKMDTSFLDLD